MTIALGHKANVVMPTYRRGCKPGHRRMEFVRGECFTCGRQDPPVFQLPADKLAKVARKRYTEERYEGWRELDAAIAQTQLKLRALALLDEVDIDNAKQYEGWLRIHKAATASVDERLREHDEDEVRWAVKAAYV